MNDFPQEGDLEPVADDNAGKAENEDRTYDNFEDAVAALADDDEGEPEEQAETETEEAEAEPEEVTEDDPDAVKVTLSDGTEIPLKELEDGQLRMQDYTRKTTELAKERETVAAVREEYAERQRSLETAFQNFQQFAEGLIPPEPPLQLAQQNPGEYQYQQALRKAAMDELGQIFAMRDEAGTQAQQANEAELARYRDTETAELVKAMPTLKDPARLAKFQDDNRAFALEMGAPEEIVDQPQPAYVQQMLHYARIGKKADHNRQNAQRRIAEQPQKGKQARAAAAPSKNREGMKRLAKSGSLRDAMSIDFD